MVAAVETMAYTGQVPWHGEGASVSGDLTPEEMATAAGLDWRVDKKPLLASLDDGSVIEVPDRYALVRDSDNKVMTITGKSWKPVQNSDLLGFMREYVEAGGATMETAGSLRGGRYIWGLARLNSGYEVSRGDRVEGYILISGSHTVGTTTQIMSTDVRVVCQNTLNWALSRGSATYRQNHLSEFDVNAAKEAVAEANEALAGRCSRAKTIRKLKLSTEDAVRKVLAPVFLSDEKQADKDFMSQIMDPDITPKTIEGILTSIDTSPGAEPTNGWGVLNGVTHWADHVAGREQSARLFRSWLGDLSRKKRETEQKLFELAA